MPAVPDHPKIVALPRLLQLLSPRRDAKTVVFTNGCFDLLHAGHADFLARAKALGDILVVGLNADESVRRLKGPARPVTPLDQRAFVLACLASTDYITAFTQDTPLDLITAIQPDILVKGGDWSPDTIVGKDVVLARGGSVQSLPLLPGISTTAVIARILTGAAAPDPT
ncbi:D-glycero-beta-D-manno-heptose 1-phosphate adenylyltransferase [Desulfolutivibrio sulfoxidireducens]|uniref:D-glycero-beta-D-manno-heptose 1-phosphate adenylyltransferase n=1 Tax=Desulfolutivibrio sulfoxidireducens TaxID=2773299 RepID=UPI00159E6D6E|nr:D-glycero-beta-D-manno-heptose 1-phosphate adenylyltransferase [Desulfolutivibrio sulfoxidireducens]QLA19748.1 D-glycero-beta-D-manno-heptose 1-phosphate adenylyltransferase [Desulfolutivibrio sulfoxidireducens]